MLRPHLGQGFDPSLHQNEGGQVLSGQIIIIHNQA